MFRKRFMVNKRDLHTTNRGEIMKSIRLFLAIVFILVLALAFFFGCSGDSPTGGGDKNGDNGGNGIDENILARDAYETIVDFAFARQIMLYDYFAIMTDNYNSGFMENDLTYEQIDKLFESLYGLAEYKADVESAIAVIESDAVAKSAGLESIEGLAKSMRDLIAWMPGSAARSRNRILKVASNMSESERTFLYNNLRDHVKAELKDENDYWKKLQDGDLDYKAPVMFNDFHHLDPQFSNFLTMSSDMGLRINKIAHRRALRVSHSPAKS